MAKFRVIYVAVKHKLTYRNPENQTGLIDDQIAFREEKAVTVDASNEQEALETVRSTVPPDCEFTAQVHKAKA